MKNVTTRWGWMAALVMGIALAGCGGSGTETAGTPAETPATTGAADPHAGHDHGPGEHGTPSDAIELTVTKDGFEPKEVRVKAGQPVTLAVTRKTDRTCATELVLKEYGINQKLPLNETVHIQFTPNQSGQLTYACAMDMIKGTIVVE